VPGLRQEIKRRRRRRNHGKEDGEDGEGGWSVITLIEVVYSRDSGLCLVEGTKASIVVALREFYGRDGWSSEDPAETLRKHGVRVVQNDYCGVDIEANEISFNGEKARIKEA
jgi:hypothetical protein